MKINLEMKLVGNRRNNYENLISVNELEEEYCWEWIFFVKISYLYNKWN